MASRSGCGHMWRRSYVLRRNFGLGRAGASPAVGVFQPDDVLAPSWRRRGRLGEHDVADRSHPVYRPGQKVDRVSRTEPAHGQLAPERTVLDIGLAGDQADRLFLVLVILQAQRVPCGNVDDLAHVLALGGGEDLLMPPGLALLLRAVDRGLRV